MRPRSTSGGAAGPGGAASKRPRLITLLTDHPTVGGHRFPAVTRLFRPGNAGAWAPRPRGRASASVAAMGRWTGSWLSGPASAGLAPPVEQDWRGQRLGQPATGVGSVAGLGRRLAAYGVDA